MSDNPLPLAVQNGVLPNHMLGLPTSEVLKQAISLAKANKQPLIEAIQEVLQGVSYLYACLQTQKVLD